MKNPEINFEGPKLKMYHFICGDITFTCKATDLQQAQFFFNQGHFYDGRKRITADNPDVFCEEINLDQEAELIQ